MTEAIILVGGQGTRLRPLTVTTPKPLLPAAGIPFVAHQIARLRAAGVTRVVLATALRPELFRAEFGDGSGVGVEIDYSHESVPLGTGGGIRQAATLLRSSGNDPVIVLNGDVLSAHDIAGQVQSHRTSGAAVTLYLTEVTDARAFGCVPTDAAGRVTAFLEKMPEPVTNRINAGCYVFRADTLNRIPLGEVVSVERDTFPGLLADGELIFSYIDTGYWLDVGTPSAFITASADIVTGRAPASALAMPGADYLADATAEIGDGVRLRGGSCLGPAVRIGAGAEIDGSVLLEGVTVGAGAVIRNSIVGTGSVVGDGAVLDGAVIGDSVTIGAGNELRAGIRVFPGTRLGPTSVRFSSDL